MAKCNKHVFMNETSHKETQTSPNHHLLRFLFSLAIHVVPSMSVEICTSSANSSPAHTGESRWVAETDLTTLSLSDASVTTARTAASLWDEIQKLLSFDVWKLAPFDTGKTYTKGAGHKRRNELPSVFCDLF